MEIAQIARVLLTASGLILGTGVAEAQQAKIPRVGLLVLGGPAPTVDAFRLGLGELGYVEGRNILIEPRFAEGQLDRVSEFATELIRLDVDVIVAFGAVGVRAVQGLKAKVPVVFAAVIDPVAAGFAATLERPGGNITGITSFDPQQPRKQFELLKQVLPGLTRVTILSDEDVPDAPSDPGWNPLERATDTAARTIGLQPRMLKVKGPAPDLDGAFSAMKREGAEALVVLEVPVTGIHRKKIAELAILHRLPTMFVGGRQRSDAGGLIAYGTSIVDTLPPLPGYVDKILKGAKPGDMPIQVITRHSVIFNLRTARAIGVAIPPELLKQADQVIE